MKKLVVAFVILVFLSLTAFAYAEAYEVPDGIEASVVCRQLSLREEPNEGARRIATLKNEEDLILLQDPHGNPIYKNGFANVFSIEKMEEGWVVADLIKPWARNLVIAEEGVRVYSSFTMSQPLTDKLTVGNEYLILEEFDEFYVISFRDGGSAWLSKEANVYKKEEAEYYSGGTRKTATAKVNTIAYSLPNESSCKVALYGAGDKVQVVSNNNEGWYIIWVNDRHAYVPMEDLSMK
ncbi:MAG: hypothetical protein J6M02_07290 [Clostridia bacterium]|nr:hypothetical protein [Clostridia bacterium]